MIEWTSPRLAPWSLAPTAGSVDVESAIPLAVDITHPASKAAAWSMTNAVRVELADRGVVVTALHVGLRDTGDYEVLADDTSRGVQAGFAEGVAGLHSQLVK